MMYYYKAFGLTFSSEVFLPECIQIAQPSTIDFSIVHKVIDTPELQLTTIHRRGVYAQSGRGKEITKELYLHWEGIATYKAIEGTTLEVQAFTDDASVLSLFTVSEALGLLLFQRGYYLLHASAVMIGAKAWVFMGSPGAGKSTTAAAFLKQGCPLLSDDLTAIVFDEQNIPYVVPAYPQLKIWHNTVKGLGWEANGLPRVSEGVNKFAVSPADNFPDKLVPLSHFVFLSPTTESTGFREEKMSAIEIPTETLKHFPLEDAWLEPDILTQLFHQSIWCAQHATMWKVQRPTSFQALEEWVKQTIEHV